MGWPLPNRVDVLDAALEHVELMRRYIMIHAPTKSGYRNYDIAERKRKRREKLVKMKVDFDLIAREQAEGKEE